MATLTGHTMLTDTAMLNRTGDPSLPAAKEEGEATGEPFSWLARRARPQAPGPQSAVAAMARPHQQCTLYYKV